MKIVIIAFLSFLVTTVSLSQSVESLNISAQLQFSKGDYLGAIETLDNEIKKSDKDGTAYYFRGLCKTFMGDKSGGCSDLSIAKGFGVKPPDKKFFGFICDDGYKLKFLKKNFYPHTDLIPEKGYRPAYSLKDTLRGSLRPERSCFDVTYYDLKVKLEPKQKFISGENTIFFKVLSATKKIQVDLFNQYSISEIYWNEEKLIYTRVYDAVFISFPKELPINSIQNIKIVYSGKPQKAENPPWFGGFVWKKDKKGNRWDGVACEYLGASSWWPCKDHMSDKPDSMQLTFTVPKDYDLISNGNLHQVKQIDANQISYTWFVKNPINCYNATFYMGRFAHFSDSVTNNSCTYPLDYYVLPYNLEKAKESFKQVKEVILVYEDLFGEYPFPEDGFGMIESPFEGMEHQGAIAYGNSYTKKRNPYLHNEYDYIIVHETAHEWWGNSLSAADMADMWIQEGFATYAELLFMERRFGYADYLKEVSGKMIEIFNFWPLVENRNVNENSFASNDVYTKGAVILHNLRCTINNDSLFFKIIKDFAVKNRKKVVTSADFIGMVNGYTGKEFNPFFDKFLNETTLPVLEYSYLRNDKNIVLKFKWVGVKTGFEMPFCIRAGNKSYRIDADTQEKEIELKNTDSFRFYNMWSGTEEVEKNAFTYYWTQKRN
jgi:aminopeptidase N